MALPFCEWSREAKDEFAKKRMEEMKEKNLAMTKRHKEVEQDRLKAEAKDSAVTSVKISKKEICDIEKEKEKEKVEEIPKVTKEREWDKGKIDQDADDWSPPKFHGYRSRAQRRNFPDRRAPKKEENWRVRSANLSKDRQSYSKFRSSGPNHKYQESSNYGTSGFRNENAGFSRQRGRAHRTNSGTYRSFQNSRFDESRKKSISGGAGSASPSLSDSELEPVKHQAKPEVDRMWQDGGINEVQHKQSRVEKWVEDINTVGTTWKEEYGNAKGNDYYTDKRSEPGPREAVKSYGYANEEGYPKKVQSSRDQIHLKNRERYDGLKYGQTSRGNSRARGSRTPTGDRTVGGFDNKNQRDFRKRNYSEKNRFRRESDLSDRTSSMKESDYHDCSKDKFNKTTSDSKSSDYSGKWEDEECQFKYVTEKKPVDKQLSARNYGKDKFNKPKSVRTTSISGSQDGIMKDNLDDDYSRNTRPHLDNRPGVRKADYSFGKGKSNKYKTDSKFVGHSGKFENENATDNHTRASRKYKMNKPSPKRTLSNPVKSVDTSSSASKTMEFNSPDDDGLWGDYDDSHCVWNLEQNKDSQANHKSSVLDEEEDDINKISPQLDSSTPVKTDCDASSDNFCEKSELLIDEVKDGNAVPEELHNDNYVEVEGKGVVTSSDDSVKSGADKNSAGLVEDHDIKPDDSVCGDNIVPTTCLNEVTGTKRLGADVICSDLTDEKHDGSNEDIECSENQKKSEVKEKQLNYDGASSISDMVSSSVDSCENKNPTETVINENESSSLPEISVCDVQNSQCVIVQSTKTGQTCSELPDSPNLKQSDLEVAEVASDLIGAIDSSINAGCEIPVEPTVENPVEIGTAGTVHSEIALSSLSMSAMSTKDDSGNISSDIVAAEPQSLKREGKDHDINSGALNMSDDGGWSTVSEDENNDVSDVEKTKKESDSVNKSEIPT